jgi:hypothetical protein
VTSKAPTICELDDESPRRVIRISADAQAQRVVEMRGAAKSSDAAAMI